MVTQRQLPSLVAIRAFEAAARLGSFARAAEELDTSAASVSYHVRRLEAQTGTCLFLRHARGVRLTAEGRQLADAASAAASPMLCPSSPALRGRSPSPNPVLLRSTH